MSEKSSKNRVAEIEALRYVDSPEVCDAVRAIARAELAGHGLTTTQERRAVARLEGKSIREIAKAEGRAPSTVAESLSAPTVRARIAAELRFIRVDDEPLLRAVLRQLVRIAFGAERPGQFGRWPDYRTRLDACVKLLHYYDAGEATTPAPRDTVEQLTVERSITATERRVATRTKPGQSKGEEPSGHP
jgi:hypothetical protein